MIALSETQVSHSCNFWTHLKQKNKQEIKQISNLSQVQSSTPITRATQASHPQPLTGSCAYLRRISLQSLESFGHHTCWNPPIAPSHREQPSPYTDPRRFQMHNSYTMWNFYDMIHRSALINKDPRLWIWIFEPIKTYWLRILKNLDCRFISADTAFYRKIRVLEIRTVFTK